MRPGYSELFRFRFHPVRRGMRRNYIQGVQTAEPGLGIGAGLVLALAAAPEIAPLLYRVSPADPVSIVGAALFLIVVAVLASLIPALRATRVDPMVALRQE